ncbi:hypothetical protein Z517_06681 [Fonsecaea pedrosoi CBS 271.37]|uniref:Unplaced genomic scaffold supercont1.4, whole genome shotgun sequence n=1 Tax=Fonsecaea pedrosoi CBS 271.37 TaxID=1442368 RepID=A0A0D2DQL5_9EURO|nr:uncharacterized protein Z517_06681 [Fonsecaea pedrosoi CBS 271.37]KIW80066.1 hypothetical protein Z517_06681 [Fonsecaea pedrosoi CBS 271.37]
MSSSESITEEAEQQLDNYLRTFNARDFAGVAKFYDEPFASISRAGVSVVRDHKAAEDLLVSTVERLKKDGFSNSVWAAPKKVIVLDEAGLVLVSCPCRRLRQDGTLCEQFTATYTLRKTDDQRWLIVAIHTHPFTDQLNRES